MQAIQLKRGILIAVEGIDGSGKTTLVHNLYNMLHPQIPIIISREPGGTFLGNMIRPIVQTQKNMCTQAEFLLFAADRAQHFNDIIIPHLQANKLVISDRMADSSLIYQGHTKNLDTTMLKRINTWAMHHIKPDLTFYLRVSPHVAAQRILQRNTCPTKFEEEQELFFERLLVGFDTLFKNKKNSHILNGEQTIQNITQNAHTFIMQWIQKKNLII